jgi:hypothetical protein
MVPPEWLSLPERYWKFDYRLNHIRMVMSRMEYSVQGKPRYLHAMIRGKGKSDRPGKEPTLKAEWIIDSK